MGQAWTTARGMWDESFPPRPTFSTADIPSLQGKVALVTGGNTGIGKETVKALISRDARVYLAARNQERGEAAIADLKQATGKDAVFLELDLGNLKSIKRAVKEFTSKEDVLHLLFNNAGVYEPPLNKLTADGYDLQFGTNVLGHFYLTSLLLPTLVQTAKSSPKGDVRVITTSSSLHMMVNEIKYNTLRDGPARNAFGWKRIALYAQSKFGNVTFASELARRYGQTGIVSISVHPGNLNTDMQRHLNAFERSFLSRFFYSAEEGALTQLWAATSAECTDANGQYMKPFARFGKAREETADPNVGARLWKWLEEQVKDA